MGTSTTTGKKRKMNAYLTEVATEAELEQVKFEQDVFQMFWKGVTLCPICGNRFYVSHRGLYVYKGAIPPNMKIRYLCSIKCFEEAKSRKLYKIKGGY